MPGAVPAAPWHLHGWGCASVHLADVAKIRHLVPASLRIVEIVPGKTLSALYFASYKDGSTVVYRELAIAVAVVWVAGRVRPWAPQLYVDDPVAIAGGRSLWGIRKSLASFERTRSHARSSVTVRVDGHTVASLVATATGPSLPLGLGLPTLGMCDDAPLPFSASMRARFRFAESHVALAPDSPLRPAFTRGAFAGLRFDDVRLVVRAPR